MSVWAILMGTVASSVFIDTGGEVITPPEDYVTNNGFYADFGTSVLYQDTTPTTPVTLDGESIGYVEDISAFNRDAKAPVLGDRPTWNSTNGSVVFDGVNDNLKLFGVNPSNTQMTFMARFRADPATSGVEVIIGCTDGTNRAWLSLSDGVLSAGVGGDDETVLIDPSASDLRSNTEFHIGAVTWSDTTVSLYLDGVLVFSKVRAVGSAANGVIVGIGDRGLSDTTHDLPLVGEISHVLVSESILSLDNILSVSAFMGPSDFALAVPVPIWLTPAATSTSTFATKGNIWMATKAMRITEVNLAVSSVVTNGEIIIFEVVRNQNVSIEVGQIYHRQTVTISDTSSAMTSVLLDKAVDIPVGSEFYLGLTKTDGTGSTAVPLRYSNTEPSFNDSIMRHGYVRFTDNDLQLGDTAPWAAFTLNTTSWSVYPTFKTRTPYVAPPVASYRYWRVYFQKAGGFSGAILNQLEFLDKYGSSIAKDTSKAYAGSQYSGSNTPDKAFDGSIGDGDWWGSPSDGIIDGIAWLAYDFTDPVALADYRITARLDIGSQMAIHWRIQGSADNVNWETINADSSDGFWSNAETRTSTVQFISNPVATLFNSASYAILGSQRTKASVLAGKLFGVHGASRVGPSTGRFVTHAVHGNANSGVSVLHGKTYVIVEEV